MKKNMLKDMLILNMKICFNLFNLKNFFMLLKRNFGMKIIIALILVNPLVIGFAFSDDIFVELDFYRDIQVVEGESWDITFNTNSPYEEFAVAVKGIATGRQTSGDSKITKYTRGNSVSFDSSDLKKLGFSANKSGDLKLKVWVGAYDDNGNIIAQDVREYLSIRYRPKSTKIREFRYNIDGITIRYSIHDAKALVVNVETFRPIAAVIKESEELTAEILSKYESIFGKPPSVTASDLENEIVYHAAVTYLTSERLREICDDVAWMTNFELGNEAMEDYGKIAMLWQFEVADKLYGGSSFLTGKSVNVLLDDIDDLPKEDSIKLYSYLIAHAGRADCDLFPPQQIKLEAGALITQVEIKMSNNYINTEEYRNLRQRVLKESREYEFGKEW